MTIRAKMHLEAIIPNTWGGSQAVFRCTYDDKIAEDRRFHKATPSGDARYAIDNPAALEQLVVGGHYYFDITPCDDRSDGLKHPPRKRASDYVDPASVVINVDNDSNGAVRAASATTVAAGSATAHTLGQDKVG